MGARPAIKRLRTDHGDLVFGHLVDRHRRQPIQAVAVFDVVWTLPDKRHRHGATAVTAVTHVGIVEQFEGEGTSPG